jgi:hypothetical protein
MQNIAAGMEKAPVLLNRASSDLFHPRFVWMPGDASYGYAAALQMKEEQHIIGHQSPPAKDFNREEVTTGQHIYVRGEKVLPGGESASLGSWSDAVSAQDIL